MQNESVQITVNLLKDIRVLMGSLRQCGQSRNNKEINDLISELQVREHNLLIQNPSLFDVRDEHKIPLHLPLYPQNVQLFSSVVNTYDFINTLFASDDPAALQNELKTSLDHSELNKYIHQIMSNIRPNIT